MSDPQLAQLQQWLQSVVTEPVELREEAAAKIVRSNERAAARRRLGIYASGYRLRLLECMRAGHPALLRFLGADLFAQFAWNYLEQQPSQTYTLYDLDAGFADYLESTRPPGDHPLFLLPSALARFERARTDVLRAPGTEASPEPDAAPDMLLMLAPMVQQTPCCRLLSLPFDLGDFHAALLREEDAPIPDARPCLLGLGRVNYRLCVTELQSWEYNLLESCKEPQPLFEALAAAKGRPAGEAFADGAAAVGRMVAGGLMWFGG